MRAHVAIAALGGSGRPLGGVSKITEHMRRLRAFGRAAWKSEEPGRYDTSRLAAVRGAASVLSHSGAAVRPHQCYGIIR